ncbi:hypothetical protein BEL07_13015 [Mycolicibacterium grossiae]|uniref:Uncharacterized protein n=1 Tax=Mycolicibacterium grossiae TaxID=1552759 RepID=A0A1E8Q5Q9_9MYCO|nr:hypothetical protein BEL07_13015 [Mycolicibacterium grossiae]
MARIDCETSITSITTAHLRELRTSCVGAARVTIDSNIDTMSKPSGNLPLAEAADDNATKSRTY